MLFISPNNEYPRYLGDVQLDDPSYQYGNPLPKGWREVADIEVIAPEPDENLVLEEGQPKEVKGVLTRVVTRRPMTEEELAIKNAPETAKAKLIALGLTEAEVRALSYGLRF